MMASRQRRHPGGLKARPPPRTLKGDLSKIHTIQADMRRPSAGAFQRRQASSLPRFAPSGSAVMVARPIIAVDHRSVGLGAFRC